MQQTKLRPLTTDLSIEDVRRVICGIVDGGAPSPHPSPPLHWIGWLALGLVRYRARQLAIVRRIGEAQLSRTGGTVPRTTWSYTRSGSADRVIITIDQCCIICRARDVGDGAHVAIDKAWMTARS